MKSWLPMYRLWFCAIIILISSTSAFLHAEPRTSIYNLSTRGRVATDDGQSLIAGFIIEGNTPLKVAVRGLGPTLQGFGLSGTAQNTEVSVFSGSTVLHSNDSWRSCTDPTSLISRGIQPGADSECTAVLSLNPGSYTAIVRDKGTGGTGLVDIFAIDDTSTSRLTNVSTRGFVGTDSQVLIAGLIVTEPCTVLLRGQGPNLANFGLTDVVANPKLTLYSGQTILASNDSWADGSAASRLNSDLASLKPAYAVEPALLATLQPGAYTAILEPAPGSSSGIGLVEVFNITPPPPVVVAPAITSQPASLTVASGSTATFSVTATGTAPLTYQWFRNGIAIPNTSHSSYTTHPTTSADNAATFSVTVSNSAGSAASASATLTVNAAAPLATVTPSRLSGVAPLMVHFSASFPQGYSPSDWFHSYDYTWSFGDPSSGAWGTNGKSKNAFKGAVAAHVFETPGTYTVSLTIRNQGGVIDSQTVTITVDDPNVVYAGTKTTCVSDTAHGDFTGAPVGARRIATNDLSTITQYATAGSRILFHRGSSWTTSLDPTWPNNGGPVTIGAYGTGTNPDSSGLFDNAPTITVAAGSFLPLDNKQDWRIMDLRLLDPTQANGSIGGDIIMQRILFLRLRAEGFRVTLGWSNWNDPNGMQIDQMAVVSCDLSNAGVNIAYVGSERLILMGNTMRDAFESHVLRVWQAYQGVISHNRLSGSSTRSPTGRLALKLHGPSESEIASTQWNHLSKRTEYTIVSDNLIGASRPYVVSIGPQDSGSDERLTNIIFERNRYVHDFGTISSASVPLDTIIVMCARQVTLRNNIFDATGEGRYFTGINVGSTGVAPPSQDVWIHNNTFYKPGSAAYEEWTGFSLGAGVRSTLLRNNLVSFPGGTRAQSLITAAPGAVFQQSGNLLADTPGFIDPNNAAPLSRNFRLQAGSPAINQGVTAPVSDDFDGNPRPIGAYDIGAFERQ